MNANKQDYHVGIGAASMLMIIIILCLTTLAILALSSARTDRALTERNVAIVSDYYTAVNKAQSSIAVIDENLRGIRAEATDEDKYAQFIETHSLMPLGTDSQIMSRVEGRMLYLSIYAGNDSTLDVTLRAAAYEDTGPSYQVLKHSLSYIDNWEPENDLKLFTGEVTDGEYHDPGEVLIFD